MPNYTWSLTALILLALFSTLAAPPAQAPMVSAGAGELLAGAWSSAAQQYAAEAFTLIDRRVQAWRLTGGRGEVGVYLQEIGSGFELSYDGEHTSLDASGEYSGYYHTASVAKLLLSYVTYRLDDLGELDIGQSIHDAVTGQTYQLQPLIHRMLTHSVNLYHNVLLRYLGAPLACQTLRELGLTASRLPREIGWSPDTSDAACLERYGTLEPPRTTPRDLGQLLATVARGDVLSTENNRLLLNALTQTIYNTRIPLGLGYAVPVAHKTGSKDYVYNDAALVLLPDNPYVLVIMTKGASGGTEAMMRQLSRDLFQWERARLESERAVAAAWLAGNRPTRSERLNQSFGR